MKKLFVILLALLLITGCRRNDEGEVDDMTRISFKNNNWILNLNYTAGTGFAWTTVYKDEAVTIDKQETHYNDWNKEITGGTGVVHYEGTVKEDGKHYLIFKYSRSWERDADYAIFTMTVKDGKISEIKESNHSTLRDLQYVSCGLKEGFFGTFVPADWDCKECEDEYINGFEIKPKKEKESVKVHYGKTGGEPCNPSDRKIEISGQKYFIWQDNDKLDCMISEQFGLIATGVDWANNYYPQLLIILDGCMYEE